MITLTDHLGTLLSFQNTPKRIISLVPSQTELLVHLGLRQKLVGITKFCIHPARLRDQITVVGGTKQVDYDKIRALQPDVIFCNKEENTKEIVGELSPMAVVHVSDIKNIDNTKKLILDYGFLLDRKEKATQLITQLDLARAAFCANALQSENSKSVAYLIWQKPYMVAGTDTFINSMLSEMGLQNAFSHRPERYPEIKIEDLKEVDEIFLSSEPFPFKGKHIATLEKHTRGRITLVNGEYFSWYGSRLLKAYPYFSKLSKELES